MKKLLLLLAFFPLLIQAQNIKAKLGTGGSFIILNHGTPGVDEFVKLLIKETGEVNWYLDGQSMYIRQSNFEYDPGKFGTYDFFHVDGTNGRLGFNVLSNTPGGVDDNLPLNSSVNLFGSIATRVRVVDGSTNYAIKQDDHIMIIDKQDNGVNDMVLPSVTISKGRELYFKRNGFGDGEISVKPQPGEQLNGVVNSDVNLNKDNASMMVVCDGISWWLMTEIEAAAVARITINATTSLTKKEDVVEVNFTAANQSIDLNLPAAADVDGKRYEIKRNANGTIFSGSILRIVPASGENLDQSTSASPYLMENDFESVTVSSNGTRWVILNKYKPENAIREVSTTSTISSSDQTLLIPSTSTIDLTLPDITTVPVGKTITVKRKAGAGTGVVTLLKSGVAVEGVASLTIDGTTLSTVTVQSDGLAWWVISKF